MPVIYEPLLTVKGKNKSARMCGGKLEVMPITHGNTVFNTDFSTFSHFYNNFNRQLLDKLETGNFTLSYKAIYSPIEFKQKFIRNFKNKDMQRIEKARCKNDKF